EFPQNAGAATGIVGAAGGLGGFFPPVFVGLVKDAEGTYTYGFVGLLVFTAVSLAIAIWLLLAARRGRARLPRHDLGLVPRPPDAAPGHVPDDGRTMDLPGTHPRGVRALRALPVQPARPRLDGAGAVPDPARAHPLPGPGRASAR